MRHKCKLQQVTSSHDLFTKCYVTKETSATFSWRHQLHSAWRKRWFRFGSCCWPDHVQTAVGMQWFGTVLMKRDFCNGRIRIGLYTLFPGLQLLWKWTSPTEYSNLCFCPSKWLESKNISWFPFGIFLSALLNGLWWTLYRCRLHHAVGACLITGNLYEIRRIISITL